LCSESISKITRPIQKHIKRDSWKFMSLFLVDFLATQILSFNIKTNVTKSPMPVTWRFGQATKLQVLLGGGIGSLLGGSEQ